MTKPFSIGELMARLRVAVSYYQQVPRQPLPTTREPITGLAGGQFDLVLDSGRHILTRNGEAVHLSPTEFNLLEMLMLNAGRLVTHRMLLHEVWGPEYVKETQLLRVYIGQLRGKIEERPERPTYIVTEPGIGYRFRDSS